MRLLLTPWICSVTAWEVDWGSLLFHPSPSTAHSQRPNRTQSWVSGCEGPRKSWPSVPEGAFRRRDPSKEVSTFTSGPGCSWRPLLAVCWRQHQAGYRGDRGHVESAPHPARRTTDTPRTSHSPEDSWLLPAPSTEASPLPDRDKSEECPEERCHHPRRDASRKCQ